MTAETFEQLNLQEFIQKAITDMNFETPSAIQAEAIPRIMNGEDVIAMAPTGSGKTVAFAIPALQKISEDNKNIQVLILCPTRELTIQAHREFEKLTKYNDKIGAVSIYGGQQIDKQFNALKRNPQVVIATPGRLMDHLRQGSIDLKGIKIVVLDEADEMLDMGFREDIETILIQTNKSHQTVLFSATMEKNIMEIAKKFQKTPYVIDVMDNLQSAPNIEQFYIESMEKDKPELITRLLDLHNVNLGLIFCNTKTNVDRLVEILKSRGFFADAIHGDMSQPQREKVMRSFKNGTIKVLVATDVAGRGIDVKNIEAVFNYDLPRDDEDYIHRIGRTGRAGSSGIAFSFVSKNQVNSLRRIERANGLQITKSERPTVEQIDESRFKNYAGEIRQIVENAELDSFREKIKEIAGEDHTELDVAAALYKLLTKKEQMKINRQQIFEEVTQSEGGSSNRRRSGNKNVSRKSSGRYNDESRKDNKDFSRNRKLKFLDIPSAAPRKKSKHK